MTDNEIIKALHFCIKDEFLCDSKCPMQQIDTEGERHCKLVLLEKCLDLINRQKAEIERLQADKIIAERHEKDARELFKNTVLQLETSKSEAIKEFAERLKEKISVSVYTYWNYSDGGYYLAEDCHFDIDDLVEEMTEVQE